MSGRKKLLVSIVGPTAAGKTRLAIELAIHFGTEILSADSRQFYREMSVGTAKPNLYELAAARHHFIDSHSIRDYYNVGMYETEALALLEQLFGQHEVVIAVGGSGLFLKALWQGFDEMPEADLACRAQLNAEFEAGGLDPLLQELLAQDPQYYQEVDRHNHQRVIRALEVLRTTGKPFSSFRKGQSGRQRFFENLKIGLDMPRPLLFERIDRRMDGMIADGLFEEAESLVAFKTHNALQTVGYSEIFDFLEGKYDREEAVRLLKRNSRRYAKRQLTWFRKDEEVLWMEPNETERAIRLIRDRLDT